MAELIGSAIFDDALEEHTFRVEFSNADQDEIHWIEIKDGKEIRHTTDPYTSGWRRFNEGLYSILPIESQL